MSTILVPLDFSDCSPHLMAEAVRFARAFGARLLLLHASEAPGGLPLDARVTPPGAAAPLRVDAALREDAQAQLAPLARIAQEAGVEALVRVEIGRITDTILRVAAEPGVRMVVMGTHGRTGFARLTLGSIAEEVLRRAEVPVLTVRTRHRPDCAARSCASCSADRSAVERAMGAELEG